LSTPDATLFLETLIQNHATTHHFWPDDVSLRNTTLFDISAVAGPKQITDVYLLGLCQQHGGTLVTLDAWIATTAVTSPHPALLRLLTP
jgi:predicted nucleic acid-binding protein